MAQNQREFKTMNPAISEEEISPKRWIRPNREVLENAIKREAESDPASPKNAVKIIWATSGEYPDGTKWERDATSEEAEKYDSWSC